jgi:hypothetical protein
MEPKHILLFLFLFVVGIGLFGMQRFTYDLPGNKSVGDEIITSAAIDHVSDGVQPMDTIYHIAFATRVDTLFKYLEKYLKLEPNDIRKIVFKDGMAKPELQTGDLLRITSENGTVKDYYLKLDKYIPGTNAYLGSITWPDMPVSFKGDVSIFFGWRGDTIPSFDFQTMNYVLILPRENMMRIPALTFSTKHPNSTVAVKRAKSLGGTVAERTITFTVTAEDGVTTNVYSVVMEKEQDTIDVQRKSTITSKFYKVSDGYSMNETIKGVKPGTPVSDFYASITKASELQTVKLISARSGAELAAADKISNGDILVVVSADGENTSKYILRVTSECLGCYTYLTSAIYPISVTGSTGVIRGFKQGTLLKKVLEGVVIPAGVTLTMVDQNDAYKTLVILNYDTAYVNVQATPDCYFEVISEDNITNVLYQLMPISTPSDAYITSDLYSVDQSASAIQFVRPGTSVASLFRNVTPAPGATMKVLDKAGFVRSSGGTIYKDDRLVVTSKDGTTTKYYFFIETRFWEIPIVPSVISDDYQIDQIRLTISGVPKGISINEFRSKLYRGFNTTLKVIDANGNESTLTNLSAGDKLVVTSADGTQSTTYSIAFTTGVDLVDVASTIRIAPNPTASKVVVQGLEKGNRLRVLNPAGIVLRDVVAESSTETISVDDLPAGIYLFVITAGTQPIKIQKIVKK